MSTLTQKADIRELINAEYQSAKDSLFGGNEISAKRELALKSLLEKGLPNTRNEEYKYTNVESLFKKDFPQIAIPASINSNEVSRLKVLSDCYLLTVVNGAIDKKNSNFQELEKGLTIQSIEEAEQGLLGKYTDNNDGLIALNTALSNEGIFINVKTNSIIKKPVHILNIVTGNKSQLVQTRNIIKIERGAELTVFESYESVDLSAKNISNTVTEVFVADNANMHHYRLQNDCENGSQLNTCQVYQTQDSNYTTATFSLDGSFVRNNLVINLDGSNITSNLFGLHITKGNQLVDNHTLVDHQKPHCNSNELYKGVADGKSTSTFNGKIYVRQDAQKTNAFQSNKNILLSNDAVINTKPQLEIYADDVKCSHGTSTGMIDEEAMFYLRSRGIGEDSAKKLLMHAFALEVLEKVENEEIRNHIEDLIHRKLD